MATEADLIDDARTVFDHYLTATSHPGFVRQTPLPQGGFLYPEPTVQADMGAFSGVFTCLWRVLEEAGAFARHYAAKPAAFAELERIVTPNPGDTTYVTHAAFWTQAGTVLVPCIPSDDAKVKNLCRTLRNGFNHFNFRYSNDSPTDSFKRLNLSLPSAIPDPTLARNYRVFICDWKTRHPKTKVPLQFMDLDSDSRAVGTHFAHLRYHLFCFLARFFASAGHPSFTDILTGQPVV